MPDEFFRALVMLLPAVTFQISARPAELETLLKMPVYHLRNTFPILSELQHAKLTYISELKTVTHNAVFKIFVYW